MTMLTTRVQVAGNRAVCTHHKGAEMRTNTVIWQTTSTKPTSMETVIALDENRHLWSVYWDADEELWFNGQGESELPPLKWWAAISFPKELT